MTEARAEESPVSKPAYLWHVGLFVATCATTFLSGSLLGKGFDATSGLYFSGTIMTILLCHEMGHFIVARRHGIDASLPFFIPLPPFISLGTLGAVIQMENPIEDRNKLVDVGAAGPLAGLAVAIPLLLYGLSLSPLGIDPPGKAVMLEGNSILYIGLKYLVHGEVLPTAAGLDVKLHPMAFAAWVGLLITMINLLPIGQLDGGHIACAALGEKHERFSRTLHWLLLVVGCSVVLWLTYQNTSDGMDLASSLESGVRAALPWAVWAGILVVMRRMSDGRYHPPVGEGRLSRGRTWLVVFMVVVLLLIFTPIPLREVIP